MEKIIGRLQEKRILEKLYQSDKAEFLAIYGRRRVGKTFLITQFFKDKGVYFEITGTKNSPKSEQLANFFREFIALFKDGNKEHPKDWGEAFYYLQNAIAGIPSSQKVVLFFDELPWLASNKSGFVQALEYFWNRHASRMSNVLLIICGSAASWMINKIIHNRGGLYGRLSAEIALQSFSLSEVEAYLKSRNILLTRKQITEVFMAAGGVPKYLSFIERGMSSSQIVNSLCFTPQGPLLKEFHHLYDSLFENSYKHVKIAQLLANKRQGMTLQEIVDTIDFPSSGRPNEALKELEESGFVLGIQEFNKKVKDKKFRLVDEYTLFYLTWIENVKLSIIRGSDLDYWNKIQPTAAWYSWAGYAFENIVLKHIKKIKEGLEIGAVATREWYWKYAPPKKSNEEGAEIDLVIDRADQCINLCEIKFYNGPYTMTKHDAETIERKKRLFQERTKTRKALFITLITPFGAFENEHYIRCIDKQLTLDSLF